MSAPTEAVSGVTGTVSASWAGLTPGVRYLGAVSHSDDAGIIAITDVSVDARQRVGNLASMIFFELLMSGA